MTVVRERALLARALLLEIAVAAACAAGALDTGAIQERREALAAVWPDGVDPEQVLDSRSPLAKQLERRAAGPAPSLASAHEALAVLMLLDDGMFEEQPAKIGQAADNEASQRV